MNADSTKRTSETDWERVRATKDEDIDLSDSPELTEEWFASATRVDVPGKPPVFIGRHPDDLLRSKPATIELAPDVAAAFKTSDQVNEALRAILQAAQRLQESPKAESVAKAS